MHVEALGVGVSYVTLGMTQSDRFGAIAMFGIILCTQIAALIVSHMINVCRKNRETGGKSQEEKNAEAKISALAMWEAHGLYLFFCTTAVMANMVKSGVQMKESLHQ